MSQIECMNDKEKLKQIENNISECLNLKYWGIRSNKRSLSDNDKDLIEIIKKNPRPLHIVIDKSYYGERSLIIFSVEGSPPKGRFMWDPIHDSFAISLTGIKFKEARSQYELIELVKKWLCLYEKIENNKMLQNVTSTVVIN